MVATCDGIRVRLLRDAQFNRSVATADGPRGVFVVPAGTMGTICDTEDTRAYTERAKKHGEDLIPVMIAGMVRYLPRAVLQLVRDG